MRPESQRSLRAFILLGCGALLMLAAAPLLAQSSFGSGADKANIPQIRPEENGLIIPKGAEGKPGNDRRVTVNDDALGLVVGKVLSEIGDRVIVQLPNGRLASKLTSEAETTSRPFVSSTKDELTKELTARFPKFKIRATKRFLYVYNTSELFYAGTSRILETMYQPLFDYWKRLKVPVHDPDTLLVVLMFKTYDEFQQYKEMPAGVVAYYNGVSNHVAMYEQSKLATVLPEIAVKQAVATVAHEGCHQILANIGVQRRLSDWPQWISEGLPEYLSAVAFDRTSVRWKGVGEVNDMRMKEISEYLKANGQSVQPGYVFSTVVRAEGLTSTGYAFAWGLTHFLAARKKVKFESFLGEVAKFDALRWVTPDEAEALFRKYFGDDLQVLEKALAQHLVKLPYTDPLENMTHYVCMATTSQQRSVAVTPSPAAVQKWQNEQRASLLAPTIEIRNFPNRTQAANFARAWLNSQ